MTLKKGFCKVSSDTPMVPFDAGLSEVLPQAAIKAAQKRRKTRCFIIGMLAQRQTVNASSQFA
jgi:hypothetical protein